MREVTVSLIKSDTHKDIRAYNLKSDKTSWNGKMHLAPSVGRMWTFLREDNEVQHTSTVKNIQYVNDSELNITTNNSEYNIKIGKEI